MTFFFASHFLGFVLPRSAVKHLTAKQTTRCQTCVNWHKTGGRENCPFSSTDRGSFSPSSPGDCLRGLGVRSAKPRASKGRQERWGWLPQAACLCPSLPQIHMLKPQPSMWWYKEVGLWEVIRFKLGREGGTLTMALVSL